MRKIYTLLLLLLTTTIIYAQAQQEAVIISEFPYYESFEDTASDIGITTYDMDSANVLTTWNHYYDVPDFDAHTGLGFVASLSTFRVKDDDNVYQVDSVDNWLVLPVCYMPSNVLGITLSFHITALDPDFVAEHYEILVSTEGGTPDKFIDGAFFEETITSAGWQERFVDLTIFAGERVWIAIRHVQGYGLSGIAVDDININAAEPCSTVTTYPYTEDFEGESSCWSVYSEADVSAIEEAGWHIYPANLGLGHDSTAAAISFSASTLNTDHWLISPSLFLLPNAERIVLSWWVRNGNSEKPREHYKVYVGEHASYNRLRSDTIVYSATLDDSYSKWQRIQVNITNFSGRIIHIGFRHCATDSQIALRLDDIRVDVYGGDPIIKPGINDNPDAEALTVYPNPTYDKITLKGGVIKHVTLFDAMGRTVMTSTDNTINMRNMRPGVYNLRAETAHGTTIKRIIKK